MLLRLHSWYLRLLSPESSLTSSILPTREPGGIVCWRVYTLLKQSNKYTYWRRKFVLFISLRDRVYTRPPPPLSLLLPLLSFFRWASELTAGCNSPPFICEESILATTSKLLWKPFDLNLSTKPFDCKPFDKVSIIRFENPIKVFIL